MTKASVEWRDHNVTKCEESDDDDEVSMRLSFSMLSEFSDLTLFCSSHLLVKEKEELSDVEKTEIWPLLFWLMVKGVAESYASSLELQVSDAFAEFAFELLSLESSIFTVSDSAQI